MFTMLAYIVCFPFRYRKLALILKRKTSTLSIRCLAKLFNLSTTSTISLRQAQPLPVNTPEAAAAAAAAAKMNFIIINSRAFADLACNFELWEKTEGSMVNLVSFFLELVSSHNPYRKKNLHTILNKVKLVPLICRYARLTCVGILISSLIVFQIPAQGIPA